jgi:hypothetical protein
MQRSTTSHPISKIPVGKEEIKEAVGEGSRNGGQTDQSNLILSSLCPVRLQPMLVVSLSPGRLSLVVAGHPTITCLTYRTSHITPRYCTFRLFACLNSSSDIHMCCLSNEKKFVKDLILEVVGYRLLGYSLNSNTWAKKELRRSVVKKKKST